MFLSRPSAKTIWEKLVSNRLISHNHFALPSFGAWFWNSSNSDCMIVMLVAWYIWKVRNYYLRVRYASYPSISLTALSVEFYTPMECDHHLKSFTNLKNLFPYSMVTSSPKIKSNYILMALSIIRIYKQELGVIIEKGME